MLLKCYQIVTKFAKIQCLIILSDADNSRMPISFYLILQNKVYFFIKLFCRDAPGCLDSWPWILLPHGHSPSA